MTLQSAEDMRRFVVSFCNRGDSNGTFAPRLAGREQKSVAPEEKFESLQISGEEESLREHK